MLKLIAAALQTIIVLFILACVAIVIIAVLPELKQYAEHISTALQCRTTNDVIYFIVNCL